MQVRNAFAGINVGTRDATYPAPPTTQYESEPNGTTATVDVVSLSAAPATYEDVSKARVSGGISSAGDEDYFGIIAGCNDNVAALVTAPAPIDGKLAPNGFKAWLYNASGSLLASSDSKGEITYDPPAATCTSTNYYVKVRKPTYSGTGVTPYLHAHRRLLNV